MNLCLQPVEKLNLLSSFDHSVVSCTHFSQLGKTNPALRAHSHLAFAFAQMGTEPILAMLLAMQLALNVG